MACRLGIGDWSAKVPAAFKLFLVFLKFGVDFEYLFTQCNALGICLVGRSIQLNDEIVDRHALIRHAGQDLKFSVQASYGTITFNECVGISVLVRFQGRLYGDDDEIALLLKFIQQLGFPVLPLQLVRIALALLRTRVMQIIFAVRLFIPVIVSIVVRMTRTGRIVCHGSHLLSVGKLCGFWIEIRSVRHTLRHPIRWRESFRT